MSDYCKKCKKELAPTLLEMIETFRDRLWELEDRKPWQKKITNPGDPDYDCFTKDDEQMLDAIHDKLNALYDYYEACEKKLEAAYDTMRRWENE